MNSQTVIKPKFKETIPYFLLDGSVQIGQEEGVASFIEDPNGSISLLVQNLDGNHTIDEIVMLIQEKYPSVTAEEIIVAIDALNAEKYLEDTSITPQKLAPYFLQRYKANLNYFSLFTDMSGSKYEIQEKINEARISLLGIGGLGTQILYHLSALGFHHVKALDFDVLDISNFNRQLLYSEADLGTPKTELAKKRIGQFNPNVNLQTTNKKIQSTQDVYDHVQGTDYIICVADRPTLYIHGWVNEAGLKLGIPMIFGGVLNTRGTFFSIIPGKTGCVQCHVDHILKTNPKAQMQSDYIHQVNFQNSNAATSPNVALLAGAMVNELVKIVTNIAPPISLGRVMEINFLTYNTREVSSWPKQNNCPVCGPKS